MDLLSIVVSVATIVITGISLQFGLRQQIGKNNRIFMEKAIASEKRHSNHEKQLELIEERRLSLEALMLTRIDELRLSLDEVKLLLNSKMSKEFIC
jgi:hypothetical protein